MLHRKNFVVAYAFIVLGVVASCAGNEAPRDAGATDGGTIFDAGPTRDDGGAIRCGLLCSAGEVCRDESAEACVAAPGLLCEADNDCNDGDDTALRCLSGRCVDDVGQAPTYCGEGADRDPCYLFDDLSVRDAQCDEGLRCFARSDASAERCDDGVCRPEQGDECVEDADCNPGAEPIICVSGYCRLDF